MHSAAILPALALLILGHLHAATAALWDAATVPVTPLDPDPAAVELGTRFTTAVPGTVTAIRFYRAVAIPSGYRANLWRDDGTLLATGVVIEGQGPVPGWQTVSFFPAVAVQPGIGYVASYHASRGGYAADVGYFNAPRTSGPLSAPAQAGVYRYGPGGFPDQTWEASNYWITPVLTYADPPPPGGVPTVPTFVEAHGLSATGIGLRWYPSTVGSGENRQSAPWYVIRRDGVEIDTVSRLDLDELYYRDTGLPSNLEAGRTYAYEVAGKGADGTVGPFSPAVAVRTPGRADSASDPRISLFHPHTEPSFESPTSAPLELGCRLRVAQGDGYLTGLRVYQASGATGPLTGRLWSAAGALLATSETVQVAEGFGWRELRFPAPIAVGGEVVASFTSPTGAYAFVPEYFDWRFAGGHAVGPLQAIHCTVGDPGTFPATRAGDRNHLVDVIWSPFPDGRTSLWNSTALPDLAVADDTLPVELGVRFSAARRGEVTAVRVYLGRTAAADRQVRIWAADGSLLGSGVLPASAGSTPGWVTCELVLPVEVSAGQELVASYLAPDGGYAISIGRLSNGEADGDLSVPADGGVFRYGGGFPAESWRGSCYWIDPVLTPSPISSDG